MLSQTWLVPMMGHLDRTWLIQSHTHIFKSGLQKKMVTTCKFKTITPVTTCRFTMQRIANNHRAGKIRRSMKKIKRSTYTRSAVTVVSIRRYQTYNVPPAWKKKGAWHATKTWWVPQKHRPPLNHGFPPSVTRRLGVRSLSQCRRLQISITHPKQNRNLSTCL